MFNECLIHLCNCTCLNMLHMLNYMLIKHKIFFKCFSCSQKVFLFWKMSKISNNCVTLFWRLASRVKPVACPSHELIQKVFATHWRVKSPNHEKDLEIFPKSGFLNFSWLCLVTCSRVEAPVTWCTQNVSCLPLRLRHGWTFQLQKTLRKVFPIFVSWVLVTC